MTHHPVQPGSANPRDFLNVDSLLDDEERLIRDTVRQFVSDRVLPKIAEWFEAGRFPVELIGEMGAMGLLGMNLDGYECAGTSNVAYGLACTELEYGDSGIRSFVSVQGSLSMFPVWAYGSEEQKQRWLPPMAAGETVGCFGLTEADAGSDPSSMHTAARRDGTDWVLNGSKMWITNGHIADMAVVWAQTEKGIRGFIVPIGTAGFTVNEVKHKMSLRASVTSELVLDDVRVPQDAVLPEAVGLKAPLSCLNEARFGILFGAVGAARACYETALEYAGEREMFGKPIASFQLIQRQLAEMMMAVNRGMILGLHIARMKDAGPIDPAHISMGKLDNVRSALEVARTARSVLGASGITLEYPVIRHMNNLESVYTYEGTNEVHTLILGEAITGYSAFS
jgi:glutaryl-CoA dehydrogenase